MLTDEDWYAISIVRGFLYVLGTEYMLKAIL